MGSLTAVISIFRNTEGSEGKNYSRQVMYCPERVTHCGCSCWRGGFCAYAIPPIFAFSLPVYYVPLNGAMIRRLKDHPHFFWQANQSLDEKTQFFS